MDFLRTYLFHRRQNNLTPARRLSGKAVVDSQKQAARLYTSDDLTKLANTPSELRASHQPTMAKIATKSSAPKKLESGCRIRTSRTMTEVILRDGKLAAANWTRGA